MTLISAGRTASAGKAGSRPDPEGARSAWTLIGWIGLAFVLMGVADIGLGIYPTSFGDAEWEFGVISSILNGFAIPTMGAYLLMASCVVRQRRRTARALAIAMVLVAVILAGLGVLYALISPIALTAAASNPVIGLGMKKAIVKGGLFVLAYIALYVGGAIRGWRASRPA